MSYTQEYKFLIPLDFIFVLNLRVCCTCNIWIYKVFNY